MSTDIHSTGSRSDTPSSPAKNRSEQLQVLVTDDSEAIRVFMKSKIEQLARGSYEVTVHTASSGEEAVARCGETPFDVVFLDVVMPGMGGLEACRRIKAAHKARVAMVSSLRAPEDHDAARAAGCDNYLAKPPQDGDIRAVLRLVSLRKLTAL